MKTTTAKELVNQYGAALIGHWIYTQEIGDYPGGMAKIVTIGPDKNAPEIVMNVCHPEDGEIGIFELERVVHTMEEK